MKEYKVGERITLEVVETNELSCEGCFFNTEDDCSVFKICPCFKTTRSDGKDIIFKIVKHNSEMEV